MVSKAEVNAAEEAFNDEVRRIDGISVLPADERPESLRAMFQREKLREVNRLQYNYRVRDR